MSSKLGMNECIWRSSTIIINAWVGKKVIINSNQIFTLKVDNTNPYLNMQYAQGAGEQELVRWREDGSPRKPTQRRQILGWRGWQKIRRGDSLLPATPQSSLYTLLPFRFFRCVALLFFLPLIFFQYFLSGLLIFTTDLFYQALSFFYIFMDWCFRYCNPHFIIVVVKHYMWCVSDLFILLHALPFYFYSSNPFFWLWRLGFFLTHS